MSQQVSPTTNSAALFPDAPVLMEQWVDFVSSLYRNSAFLVVDTKTFTVAWSSSQASDVLPELKDDDGQSLRRGYPELCRFIREASANIDASADTWLLIGGKPLQCRCAVLNKTYGGLLLGTGTDSFIELSKYMADREQLFTTSRTITVSEMATTLAHEINQPVGAVSNILKGLKIRLARTPALPDEYLTAIDRALEQTDFTARIVSRIRDFTHARQPRQVRCEVWQLLEESLQLLDWVLVYAGVNVELSQPHRPLWVSADVTLLQQVFTNLIRNAVDALGESERAERRLWIRAFACDTSVRVEIADNGNGLSESARDSIFVPFVTQKTKGMGVGLNICRSFVELHQGKLWLMPNEDGGCTACVSLPICESADEAAAEAKHEVYHDR